MKNTSRIGIVLALSFIFFAAEIAGKIPLLFLEAHLIVMLVSQWALGHGVLHSLPMRYVFQGL